MTEDATITTQHIADQLGSAFPQAGIEPMAAKDPTVRVKPEHLVEVATYLRDQAGLDYLSHVTGIDYSDRIEVLYYLYSMKRHLGPLALRVSLSRENPQVPSLVSLWSGADWQEREVYDLLGVVFTGHPNLKRILLWDGFPGYPLRKDFQGEPEPPFGYSY